MLILKRDTMYTKHFVVYKQAYQGLFPMLNSSFYHSVQWTSGVTRRKSWWKSWRGFMRESWGESRGKLCWSPHWGIIVTWKTFWSVIGIVSLVCKVSVTASTCISVPLCLVYFDTMFWVRFVSTNVTFENCLNLRFFTRNWIICFHLLSHYLLLYCLQEFHCVHQYLLLE